MPSAAVGLCSSVFVTNGSLAGKDLVAAMSSGQNVSMEISNDLGNLATDPFGQISNNAILENSTIYQYSLCRTYHSSRRAARYERCVTTVHPQTIGEVAIVKLSRQYYDKDEKEHSS